MCAYNLDTGYVLLIDLVADVVLLIVYCLLCAFILPNNCRCTAMLQNGCRMFSYRLCMVYNLMTYVDHLVTHMFLYIVCAVLLMSSDWHIHLYLERDTHPYKYNMICIHIHTHTHIYTYTCI